MVGWVGWVVGFLSWLFFPVSCFSSWFVVSSWLLGLVGVEISFLKFPIFASGFQLVGWVGWVVVFELIVFSS